MYFFLKLYVKPALYQKTKNFKIFWLYSQGNSSDKELGYSKQSGTKVITIFYNIKVHAICLAKELKLDILDKKYRKHYLNSGKTFTEACFLNYNFGFMVQFPECLSV